MQTCRYAVRFLTPAFLGDAQHRAEWRVPPFKALIRQWWRIVHAPSVLYNVNKLHQDEVQLFGGTPGTHGQPRVGRSKVIISLDHWRQGSLTEWNIPAADIVHEEVKPKMNGIIDAHVYLGYGPLQFNRGWKKGSSLPKTVFADTVGGYNPKKKKAHELKPRSAIAPLTESATLTLRFPDAYPDEIARVMQLIHWFGTLGSRSRNGWGSVELTPLDGTPELHSAEHLQANNPILSSVCRMLTKCLKEEWQHAIGTDNDHLLIWRTNAFDDWQAVMKSLAETKIAFRTAVPFSGPQFQARHLLGYPVTNHPVSEWGREARLANQIRFKVVRVDDTHYRGIIIHLPCGLPREMQEKINSRYGPDTGAQATVWGKVHEALDKCCRRVP